MNELVFISDLHLSPNAPSLQEKFNAFIEWAKKSTKSVYILGDFFHLWVGDDAMDAWSQGIAKQLHTLKDAGISVFYMHGNRDFLLGPAFAKQAGWEIITEPQIITLDGKKILLMHGDALCTQDKSHQRLRWVTCNRVFRTLFLKLPLQFRLHVAQKLRAHSMMQQKSVEIMDVVPESVLKHMLHHQVDCLIHGHTHKPGITHYPHKNQKLTRFVLSDWDDKPAVLSYNQAKGLFFEYLGCVDLSLL